MLLSRERWMLVINRTKLYFFLSFHLPKDHIWVSKALSLVYYFGACASWPGEMVENLEARISLFQLLSNFREHQKTQGIDSQWWKQKSSSEKQVRRTLMSLFLILMSQSGWPPTAGPSTSGKYNSHMLQNRKPDSSQDVFWSLLSTRLPIPIPINLIFLPMNQDQNAQSVVPPALSFKSLPT